MFQQAFEGEDAGLPPRSSFRPRERETRTSKRGRTGERNKFEEFPLFVAKTSAPRVERDGN